MEVRGFAADIVRMDLTINTPTTSTSVTSEVAGGAAVVTIPELRQPGILWIRGYDAQDVVQATHYLPAELERSELIVELPQPGEPSPMACPPIVFDLDLADQQLWLRTKEEENGTHAWTQTAEGLVIQDSFSGSGTINSTHILESTYAPETMGAPLRIDIEESVLTDGAFVELVGLVRQNGELHDLTHHVVKRPEGHFFSTFAAQEALPDLSAPFEFGFGRTTGDDAGLVVNHTTFKWVVTIWRQCEQ